MPFDTELDGQAHDYSGNNLTGNLTGPAAGGGPNWTASGLAGGAMQFDGTDDKVKISQPLQALTGNNFTIEAWVNMRIWGCDNPEYPIGAPGECPVFTQYSYPTGYYFYVYNGRPSLFASFTEAISPDTITTNEWHHLAGVANTTHLLIYVDGVLKASSPFSGVGSSSDAYIGGDGSVLTDFNGTIDEVIVWNSALPAGQIQLHAARIYNKLASAAQSIGGAWTCSVTPIDEDGINGTTAASQVSPQECGNGVVEPPEQCEPPGTSSCSQSCNMLALPVYLNPGAIPPGETRTINSGAPVPDQFNITINWSGESRTFTWWKDKASLFSAYTLRRGDDVAREELVS
ncbi:MAG: LamG domain-containing protein [Candidatus Aenigmarchaeota archaeon]|nr:LamG domain-containing protein [Candidatus Aenigmarchaeota archaeon]